MKTFLIPLRKPRLLPMLVGALALLVVAKVEALWRAVGRNGVESVLTAEVSLVAPAAASSPPAEAPRPQPASAPVQQAPAAEPPDAAQLAERALLESLRSRRQDIEAREAALRAREQVLEAAEKRLTVRLQEMETLQRKLVAEAEARNQQDEAGWRGLVKVYESMKPRDAAAIFDELEMPVLVQLVARMKEAKVSPVIGAMRPERARELTTELARLRAGRSG